jgi:hypothetical protein
MLRDPLYRQIRRGLRELNDGNTFELCANDLLRRIYPSLAPREGGDDAGLDGLVASENKHSIQLICTTGLAVLGNLSGSIESNLKKGGKSHACILATSQRLTNPRKRTLEDRAKELGRPLIQIYDQAAMAQLLYRDAHWLKELLGLAGNPPPLSIFPITTRPFFDVQPLGRADDLAKITHQQGDVVLVGQPGSGKTHLLFAAAKKAKGRFVVDEDPKQVADGVRSVQPHFLIVDDAHSRLEFLKRLRLLRQQIDADFRIVASCWPGQEQTVCAALQVAKEKCHVLEGLPQKQIKEVIQSQRIFGPEHLVTEIIHQSQGKPGLAVTLCRLCWENGTARDVVLGTALARDIKLTFEPLLGQAATHLLACFSIGGDAGMTLEAVARLLGRNALEIKRTVEQLSAAGVLDISPENRMSVHPLRLRQALVRDVFLKPPTVDLAPYLSEAPDFAAATRVLIEAKLMGGVLINEMLQIRLRRLAGTYEQLAFEEYAHLGRHEAEWVLENYPDKLKAVAPVALNSCPEETLRMLLDFAIVAHRERASQGWSLRTEDVMPEIKRWILSAKPNDDDASKRREILAISLEKWPAKNKEPFVVLRVAELVLSIKYEAISNPPGEPMTVTFHSGVVAQERLSRIASLWPKVLPILRAAPQSHRGEIANVFHEWVYPNFHGRNTPKEYESESRSHAKRMMADLLAEFCDEWTLHHKLRRYAEILGLKDALKIDPIADVLFPSSEPQNWREAHERQQAAADKLAEQWSKGEPDRVVEILTRIERQSRASSISCMSWDRHVCFQIAQNTNELEKWTAALFNHHASPRLIEPFLERLATTNAAAAATWISHALVLPDLRVLGVCMVLGHFNFESPLWSLASQHFKECSYSIGIYVLHGKVRNDSAKTLLQFPEQSVASTVAVNLWNGNSTPKISNELLQDWKNVMVEHVDEAHVLEGVFDQYSDVAFDWIAKRLEWVRDAKRPFWFGMKYDRALPAALNKITKEQRHELIDKMPRSSAVSELVRALVGRDMELFLHVLSREELEDVRLDPLRLDGDFLSQAENVVHEFDEGWQKMAVAALGKGFSEQDIFCATQAGGFGWSGPKSAMFAARLAPFEKLLQHTNDRLRIVGRIGVANFSKLRDENLEHEKRAAVRGEVS